MKHTATVHNVPAAEEMQHKTKYTRNSLTNETQVEQRGKWNNKGKTPTQEAKPQQAQMDSSFKIKHETLNNQAGS